MEMDKLFKCWACEELLPVDGHHTERDCLEVQARREYEAFEREECPPPGDHVLDDLEF